MLSTDNSTDDDCESEHCEVVWTCPLLLSASLRTLHTFTVYGIISANGIGDNLPDEEYVPA